MTVGDENQNGAGGHDAQNEVVDSRMKMVNQVVENRNHCYSN